MKLVLDTNVIISAFLWEGEAAKITQLIEKQKAVLFMSAEIAKEIHKVLNLEEIIKKTHLTAEERKSLFFKIVSISEIIEPKIKVNIIRDDPDDNKIIECAIEAKADYIISYDKHLLKIKEHSGIKIVHPTDFMKEVK